MNKNSIRFFSVMGAFLGLVASGCGKQAYVASTIKSEQQPPGSHNIPPKVDILFAYDDSGSMLEIQSQINAQMPAFLQKLENMNWDYHFALTPLTAPSQISRVYASRFDGNWGSQWIAPYPGAVKNAPGTVTSSFFRALTSETPVIGSRKTNGLEPGFQSIQSVLTDTQAYSSNFHRPDATLIMIVMGNGDDTSDVTQCQRGDGLLDFAENMGPSEARNCKKNNIATTYAKTYQSSLNFFYTEYLKLRSSKTLVRFYAATSQKNGVCLGANSDQGTRYMLMANALSGSSYDLCSKNVSGIFDAIAENLEIQKLEFRTRYLFTQTEPNPTSIRVIKYHDADGSQSEEIPQDATNGWTYAGYLSNVHAIDYPVPMSVASGFAIELHGSAKLQGNDTARVEYRNLGGGDVVATTGLNF